MIDPVSITAIKVACDVVIGALPQSLPVIHDESTRKRLIRFDVLLQKVGNGNLTLEDLIKAKELYLKIHTHALLTQNATVLAYLDNSMLLLTLQESKPAEKQIDLIMLEEDFEERLTKQTLASPSSPASVSVKSKASIAEVANFVQPEEQSFPLGLSVSTHHQMVLSDITPAYSSELVGMSLPSKDREDREEREDAIIEESPMQRNRRLTQNSRKQHVGVSY